MIITVTGHRPPKLGLGYGDTEENRAMVEGMCEALQALPGYKNNELQVISGMALGVDQLFVQACLALDIPWTAAIPFRGQESRWPPAAQSEYHHMLTFAVKVIVVGEKYTNQAFQTRNEWMVDHSELVMAFWDGSPGGTANCVTYAQTKGVTVQYYGKRGQPRA